jgi:hypothetical protein
MVGPCVREWNVLRETDGERFVALKKGCGFSGEFANHKKEFRLKKI